MHCSLSSADKPEHVTKQALRSQLSDSLWGWRRQITFSAQSRWGSERVKYFCASTRFKSECENWKALFSKLVQLFMKVWLSLFLRLVKLSKSHWSEILCRQGRLISYHGNCIKMTFRQWQILTKKKCPSRNIYSSSHHVYKTASVMSKMNSFNSNRRI